LYFSWLVFFAAEMLKGHRRRVRKREVYSSFEWKPRKKGPAAIKRTPPPTADKLTFFATKYDNNLIYLRTDIGRIVPKSVTEFRWIATCKLTEVIGAGTESTEEKDDLVAEERYTMRGDGAWSVDQRFRSIFRSITREPDGSTKEREYGYLMSDVKPGAADEQKEQKDAPILQWEIGPVKYLEKQVRLRLCLTLTYEENGEIVQRRYLDHRFEPLSLYMDEITPVTYPNKKGPIVVKEEKNVERQTQKTEKSEAQKNVTFDSHQNMIPTRQEEESSSSPPAPIKIPVPLHMKNDEIKGSSCSVQ
jgi:hypothetical protein